LALGAIVGDGDLLRECTRRSDEVEGIGDKVRRKELARDYAG
jgi:hypothetical protein